MEGVNIGRLEIERLAWAMRVREVDWSRQRVDYG